jgi:beta-fructofuranosidase
MVDGDFMIQSWGRLSYGDSYYAGAAFADADGRAGLIYWLRGIDDTAGQWAGAHSVPQLLGIDENDVLIAEPHPNIAKRRGRPIKVEPSPNRASPTLPLVAEAEWDIDLDRPASLSILSTDGTAVMRIDTAEAALQIRIGENTWQMPSSAHIHLIIDGPIIELFSRAGVFAAAIPAAHARMISVTDSACTVYGL